jgi:hypothetical protein
MTIKALLVAYRRALVIIQTNNTAAVTLLDDGVGHIKG